MHTANLQRTVQYALILWSSLLGFLPGANGAAKAGINSDSIIVLARLPLPGTPVRQMFLQESGGRQYLYIRQVSQPGYTVIEVTKAWRPSIVKQINLPNDFPRETLEMVGVGLGIAGRPDTVDKTGNEPASHRTEEAPSNDPPTQFIRLLDLSDSSRPRTLTTFDGVTTILLEDRRNLIYLTNRDGLWILYHRIDLARQICEYISTYSAVPMMCDGY
jgi:hypothetical protein